MEDNKLKLEIEKVLFSNEQSDYTPKLYSLISDVACTFTNWYENIPEKLATELFYKWGEVTFEKYFAYFITHVYQPR